MATTAGYSFSYAPKPQAALASLAPVTFGEGLRFSRQTPLEMRDQRPEAVAEGFYKGQQQLVEGISTGILAGLGKVVDAYTTRRQKEIDKTEQEKQSEIEHDRAVEIAQIKAAKTPEEIQEATLSRDIKQKQLEKLSKEVDDRIEDTVPEGVKTRGRGFFKDNPNLLLPPVEVDLPTKGGASTTPTDAAKALAGMPEIDIPEPDVTRGRAALAAIPEIMVPAQSAGKLALQGEELDLVPISTQPGAVPMVPAQPVSEPPAVVTTPPAQPAEPAAAETSQTFSRYELEDYFAGAPYESLADAKYAADQLKSVGYNTKIVPEGTGKQKIFYIEYERPDEIQAAPSALSAPEGFFTKERRDVDGKITKVQVPKIEPKQQLRTLISTTDKIETLERAINKIEELTPGLIGLGGQGAGGMSWLMSKLPWSNDAKTVRGLLETVRGIIGFDELVALKAAGGSLGALSDAELAMLTSLRGSLNPDLLSEETFLENVAKIKESTIRLKQGLEQDKANLLATAEKPQGVQQIQGQGVPKINSQADWEKLKPNTDYMAIDPQTGMWKVYTKK
jgi:hypothetical protein